MRVLEGAKYIVLSLFAGVTRQFFKCSQGGELVAKSGGWGGHMMERL